MTAEKENMRLSDRDERSDEHHTPSPWAESGYEDQWGHGRMVVGNNGRGKYVCHVYTSVKALASQTTVKWQANRHANLRLILASPDLLDACRQARDLFEDDEGIAHVLDAAIAKATREPDTRGGARSSGV